MPKEARSDEPRAGGKGGTAAAHAHLQGIFAITLWGAGCYLLHLAWSLTQALPPPLADALGTAVYLVTFFYIFAFWPIQSLVERLFEAASAAAGAQKP